MCQSTGTKDAIQRSVSESGATRGWAQVLFLLEVWDYAFFSFFFFTDIKCFGVRKGFFFLTSPVSDAQKHRTQL